MTFVDSCFYNSLVRLFSIFVRKKVSFTSAGRFHMDRGNDSKNRMEIINVPPILSIYRHAVVTFDDKNKAQFSTNLSKLKSMMDGLKAEHLGFDKRLAALDAWKDSSKAPCTYIEVFQNSTINMSIFVLKPGFTMPLHDHPQMHGLLKVISGTAKIRSFTEYPLKEVVKRVDFATRAKLEALRLTQGLHKRRKLFAEVTSDQTLTDSSPSIVLTPSVSNYHEIQSFDVPAAFFDILAPPYDTFHQQIGPRRCHYYHIVHEISTNVVQLQETEVPDCFYCDQAPYLGPALAKNLVLE